MESNALYTSAPSSRWPSFTNRETSCSLRVSLSTWRSTFSKYIFKWDSRRRSYPNNKWSVHLQFSTLSYATPLELSQENRIPLIKRSGRTIKNRYITIKTAERSTNITIQKGSSKQISRRSHETIAHAVTSSKKEGIRRKNKSKPLRHPRWIAIGHEACMSIYLRNSSSEVTWDA